MSFRSALWICKSNYYCDNNTQNQESHRNIIQEEAHFLAHWKLGCLKKLVSCIGNDNVHSLTLDLRGHEQTGKLETIQNRRHNFLILKHHMMQTSDNYRVNIGSPRLGAIIGRWCNQRKKGDVEKCYLYIHIRWTNFAGDKFFLNGFQQKNRTYRRSLCKRLENSIRNKVEYSCQFWLNCQKFSPFRSVVILNDNPQLGW